MAPSPFFKQETLLGVNAKEEKLPEKIGPYIIEALIAKSLHSILYLGFHPEKKEVVALKVLSPEKASTKEMVESFLKEGSITGLASHPNIVKLFEQGAWEGGLYLAMEFIRGVSLRQFIQQSSLSIKRSLDIILQVCYALCHLHAHGIIHGDLKPENILIQEDGEIKVVDFGIAQLHDQKSRLLSHAGTPSYMSPEHKKSAQELTYRSDIYSLGIIAYELIIGKLSFGIIQKENIPKSLRPIILKCLEKDQNDRYQDIVDLIFDLSNLLKSKEFESPKSQEAPLVFEELFFEAMLETFPLPDLKLDAIDLGFSRKMFSKIGSNPLFGKILPDSSLLLGAFSSEGDIFEKTLSENKIGGTLHALLSFMGQKKWSFKDFMSSFNRLLYEQKIKASFSFVHISSFMDELSFCHGGAKAPLYLKKSKNFSLDAGSINLKLGESLNELSLGNLTIDIGDQLLIHVLNQNQAVHHLQEQFISHAFYAAQNLSDTLIQKGNVADCQGLISMIKVK